MPLFYLLYLSIAKEFFVTQLSACKEVDKPVDLTNRMS